MILISLMRSRKNNPVVPDRFLKNKFPSGAKTFSECSALLSYLNYIEKNKQMKKDKPLAQLSDTCFPNLIDMSHNLLTPFELCTVPFRDIR